MWVGYSWRGAPLLWTWGEAVTDSFHASFNAMRQIGKPIVKKIETCVYPTVGVTLSDLPVHGSTAIILWHHLTGPY